ncbi:MAG TPA: hypothetical protein VEN81_16225 [Planctomycetota bacterium]|nr:hypothetical protein [Planctomycetota bacterium]
MKAMGSIAVLLFLAPASIAQDKKPDSKPPALPEVDESKVAEAIRKGVAFLKQHVKKLGQGRHSTRELFLLAMIHSGVSRTDPVVNELLEGMLAEEPLFTYRTALRAMILEEIDRAHYQPEIFKCAQFLVDNQGSNGQWSYGEATTYPTPTVTPSSDVATGGGKAAGPVVFGAPEEGGTKPALRAKIPVSKQRSGPDKGDNSNSQYAALGLRACHDAGIILPKDVIDKAMTWWRHSQEGTSRGNPPAKNAPVATGPLPPSEPRGWNYGAKGAGYGSMTVGATGALVIYDFIGGKDWKKDQDVLDGLAWEEANFTVAENPKHPKKHHLYYLYGLERAGMLFGAEKIGTHPWYSEGAKALLESQGADGSWENPIDTCFAILFLRRATRPLVETPEAGRLKK